jgi:2-(1,2-epoxy-1,2-dihydrophenyl)acetyl-CoA isomerase
MDYEVLIFRKEKGVAVITLNNPEIRNALSDKMMDELLLALDEIEKDDEIRAVVITGAGRAFSSGGNVSGMQRLTESATLARDAVFRLSKLIMRITELEKPIIAAVNGAAVGAGCNLALAADIVVASEGAVFSEIFVRIGLLPDAGGMFILPRLVGVSNAKRLCFTGDMVNAAEAERMGLANKVVPAEQLEAEALGLAERLAQGPTKAIALTKRIINRSLSSDLAAVCEYEAQAQAILLQTEDFREGMQAFLEKREPKFKGR